MAAGISVRLSLNDSLFQAGIRRASAAVVSFGKTAASVGFKTLSAAVAGGAVAMIAGAKHIINLGDDLLRMKRITGLSVSSLFILREAFEQAGTSAESIGPAIGRMQSNLFAASKNSVKFTAGLKAMGIDAQKFMAMKPEEKFLLLGKAINNLPEGQRQAAALERFGKSGLTMLPVLAELKDFDSSSLQKQAAVIERNAEAFDNANDAIRRMKTNAQGLFVGLATRVAPMIANLGKRLEAVDFVAWGDKIADALMNATQMGLALWNDPAGVMGFFWASAKAYVLEFGNWLVDAIDGAFPGIGATLTDAIIQTQGWGEILIGYAVKFGTVLRDGIMFVVNKVKDAVAMLPKGAFNVPSALGFGGGSVAKNALGDLSRFTANAPKVAATVAQRDIGQVLVDRGNKRLADRADAASRGLTAFKRGTDHFGAAAAKQAAELAKVKIAPALEKAKQQMVAIGLGRSGLSTLAASTGSAGVASAIAARANKYGTGNWREASSMGILRGASMAGTLSGAFGSTKFGGSSLQGASLLNGIDAASERRKREAAEKDKLKEGVDGTNDRLDKIYAKFARTVASIVLLV